MSEPAVTVLLSTFEGARFLDAQLASLVAQTETNWIALVADDGSTDTTRAVLDDWARRELRITVLPADGRRLGPARRYLELLAEVQTPWWAFCDQDDAWFPEHLARLLAAAAGGPACTAVCADAVVADASLREVAPSAMARRGRPRCDAAGRVPLTEVLLHNKAIGMTMLGSRQLAAEATRRPELFEQVAMHDWWVALVAASLGELHYVDAPVAAYRQHGANVTGAPGWPSRIRAALRRNPAGRARWIVGRAATQAAALAELTGGGSPEVRLLAEATSSGWLLPTVVRLERRGVRLPFAGQRLQLLAGAAFVMA